MSETLEAGQRVVSGQVPRVRVIVRDKQGRFTWVGNEGTDYVHTSMCVAADGKIVVAALDSSGVIRVRRVTDPSSMPLAGGAAGGDGWGVYPDDYTQVVTGVMAFPHGDVAISNNSGTLRLFYMRSDGTKIYSRESTDNGASWGGVVDVKTLAGGVTYLYKLASAGHDDVFWCYSRAGYRYVYYRKKAEGAWGSEVRLDAITETYGEFNNCYGLTAVWWAARSRFAVVAALSGNNDVDGRMVTCLFDGTSTWGVQRIAPPGYATLGFTALWPSLVATDGGWGQGWVLTYIEKYSSSGGSWKVPVCIRSRYFVHWSYKIPLGFSTYYETRVASVVFGAVGVYAHKMNQAYRLRAEPLTLTIGRAQIRRYMITERPQHGDLIVELDNRDGGYDDPTSFGGPWAGALQPLAQVVIDQGLKTSAGDERVECRPFLLWGMGRVRESGANWMRLYCHDGWELFRRWRPDAVYVWKSKTVKWCITELACRVGYFSVAFDASAEWDQTVSYLGVAGSHTDWSGRHHIRALGRWVPLDAPSLVFDPGMDGVTVLEGLLGLVGGVARWGNGDTEDVLYCSIPSKDGDPAAGHSYGEGEVLEGLYVHQLSWPTRVRASGESVLYVGADYDGGLKLGMEIFQPLYSKNWGTTAMCQVAAEGALDDAAARGHGGRVQTRPNVGLELFDVIEISDARAGGGLTSVKRRVNGIVTEYEPLHGQWQQTVYVEGV